MPKLNAKFGFNRDAVLSGPIELVGGVHLRITYAWSDFQAGVSFPLLEEPQIELNYIKGKVIRATCK